MGPNVSAHEEASKFFVAKMNSSYISTKMVIEALKNLKNQDYFKNETTIKILIEGY